MAFPLAIPAMGALLGGGGGGALGIAGSVLGGLGGLFGSSSKKKAAKQAAAMAQYTPWNTTGGLFGNAVYDTAGKSAGFQQSALGGQIQNWLGGQLGAQNAAGMFGQASPGIEQVIMGSGMNPNAWAYNPGAMQGLFGSAAGVADPSQAMSLMGNSFGQASGLLGQAYNQASGNLGGAFNLLGQGATQAMSAVPGGQFDPSALINDRLNLLREQAAPQEQKAMLDLEQRLFSQGRLGSTGGAQQFGQFGEALARADLGRQLAAQDLGMQASQLNQAQQGLQLNQAGLLGNLGMNMGNLGIGQSNAMAGIGGQLGQLGLGMGGQMGQLGLGYGGLLGDFAGQLQQAQQFGANLGLQGQQALGGFGLNQAGALQGLLGLGMGAFSQDAATNQNILSGLFGLDAQQRDALMMGANLGEMQAAAGARAGQLLMGGAGSPGGSLLAGVGSGLLGMATNRLQNK